MENGGQRERVLGIRLTEYSRFRRDPVELHLQGPLILLRFLSNWEVGEAMIASSHRALWFLLSTMPRLATVQQSSPTSIGNKALPQTVVLNVACHGEKRTPSSLSSPTIDSRRGIFTGISGAPSLRKIAERELEASEPGNMNQVNLELISR